MNQTGPDDAADVALAQSGDGHAFERLITVEGVAGDIQASSVEGGIVIRGAGGNVTVNTVEGELTIDGGRGRIP